MMKTRSSLGMMLAGALSVTGCAEPPTSEVDLTLPQRAYDDEMVHLGQFHGFVDESGQLQISMVPSQELR